MARKRGLNIFNKEILDGTQQAVRGVIFSGQFALDFL